MSLRTAPAPTIIGRAALDMTRLPAEDLPLVIEFIGYLKRQQRTVSPRRLTVAEMRAEARRRANLLQEVPRAQVVARFRELTEEIRREAIAKGTATEGDWHGD